MIEHIHPEGEPTPTLRDLYDRKDGFVEVITWSTPKGSKTPQPSKYRLTDKGYAELGAIMRRNAAASLARGTTGEEGAESVRRLVHESKGKVKGNGGKGTSAPD